MNFTKQQIAAVESRDKNLLVAAAAGSGKTTVLVERIVQLILSGKFSIDKMLIVTFTNAAANEMRTRIHKAIAEKIASDFDAENLERQQILLSGASIMTFHAFCLSVLRRHFAKIELDPKFREADEHELNILKQDVIEELFETNYEQRDENFLKFTDDFGGTVHGDSDLHALILKLHTFAQSRPYPRQWLNSLVELYQDPENFHLNQDSNWLDFVKNFALSRAKSVLNISRADCAAIIRLATAAQCFNADSQLIINLAGAAKNLDNLFAELQAIKFARLDSKKIPPEILDELKTRRELYKKKIQNLRKTIITAPTSQIVAEMKNLADSIRQLVQITLQFDDAFTAAKREKNIIDFNDMEHLALEIFNTDAPTAAYYRQKFQVILVDEYQDTNGVQEEIISKIVSPNNFFAVGDVKQSIYRFRNADPEIFLQKYRNYIFDANSERIDLSTNFRSRRQILTAVNSIFQRLMTRDAMEVDYDADARLNFGADYPTAKNSFDENPELCIINLNSENKKSSDDDADDAETAQDLDKLELEIQLIANKINAIKNKFVRDGNSYRKLELRDIVILFRSMDGTAAKIVEVLQKNNIPAYAADKDGYFRAPEIQTILSLLKILDNAHQDIPLATVMLSPIGGFSAEDLAKLRIADRNSDLYTLVSNDASCQDFLDKINRWREMAYKMSVPELLSKIYRETGYYDYFGGKPNGKIPQANLRMLIDRAAAYEKTAFRGLSRFIQFIKKMRDLGNDLAAARTLSESENVVRVMTIHKSKGLEFPVVFVAGLGKQFNLQDLRDTIILHRNLGIGIYNVLENGARVQTFARRIIASKVKAEMLAEELRILYVAFTRAKEKLFMVATAKNSNAIQKFDAVTLDTETIQSASRPLDWLLMAKNFTADIIDVEIIDAKKIVQPAAEIPAETEAQKISAVEKLPPSPLENIPAKFSVTELKRRLDAEDDETIGRISGKKKFSYRRPNFLQKVEITAAEFGTIMHSVMQHLDLAGDLSVEGIVAQIDEMFARQLFTDEQTAIVKRKANLISAFFTTEIGRRIISAQEIYRELPFNQYIDAGKIFSAAAGEKIFVQGIIDVLFRDAAGNWILLDYKTDRNNSDEHFRREYRRQIEFYTRAVEAVTNCKIAEKYLYLLSAGRLVDMNFEG